MGSFRNAWRHLARLGVLGSVALAWASPPVPAQPRVTNAATLLDRIQIEDLLVAYYQPFGSAGQDMTAFYAEDGQLDLNGRVYRGKAGVRQAYREAARAMGPSFKGKFHVLMNNPRSP